MYTGLKYLFTEGIVPRQQAYRPSVFDGQQHEIVQNEIQSLLLKGVLRELHSETGEFVSTIFLRPKNDGSFRMILNLKQFSESVEYHQCKMDTLVTFTRMMKPGCFMASADLKDAYYTVPIHSDHQKYLKFMFIGTLYANIHVYPMGYQVLLYPNFPGVDRCPLHYLVLEHDKSSALAANVGNYEASLHLSKTSVEELKWWVSHVPHAKRHTSHGLPSVIIQSDASKKGWGALFECQQIGGRWIASEASRHTNIFELEAAFFALKSFGDNITGAHIQLELDNTTAVAYINNVGGSKSLELNFLAIKIWDWSIQRDNLISAVHLAGKLNVRADAQSRNFSDKHEWTLNSSVFEDIVSQYPVLSIDFFATKLNHKLPTYCSWKPDPGCSYIDAFQLTGEPKPKYDDIWDASKVLNYLSMLHPVKELPLKDYVAVTSHWPERTINTLNDSFSYEACRIRTSIPNT
ncbi:uncharacterized protein [Montipora capricornis]|uniref:uncharacterized protein n=1 Tax=Montipora capricornis TaxID=246305 RepID=UPI0035F19E49